MKLIQDESEYLKAMNNEYTDKQDVVIRRGKCTDLKCFVCIFMKYGMWPQTCVYLKLGHVDALIEGLISKQR